MPKRILIADASPTDALALTHILEAQGNEVLLANSGSLAFKMALEVPPSLVITVADLPETDGYQLTARLKSSPELQHVPVILVLNVTDAEDAIRILNCGADRLLLRPYEKGNVIECINNAWANLDSTPYQEPTVSVQVEHNGHRHCIKTSTSKAILLLLSTYKTMALRHRQLLDTHAALQQHAAETLSANRFLDSIIECDPSLICIKEAGSLRYTRINRAFESVVGIPRDELLGKKDDELFPADIAEACRAIDVKALESRSTLEFREEPVHTRARGRRLLHTKKMVVLGENGEPSHILGFSEDVTAQRALEKMVRSLNAELAEKIAELEASNKDLDSFSYSVAHDLRNPLSVIGGYAGLLEKQFSRDLDGKCLKYVQTIRQAVMNMSALIDDLLAFSKLARQAVKKDEVDMDLLVQKVTRDVLHQLPQAQRPAIEVVPLLPAQGDSSLLTQVWTNLISNAVKYSRKAESPQISISSQHDGTEVIYSVKDNGAGFDMSQYEKLFGIFQRLHGSHEFEGTGIGLAIVHRVVIHHGGRVWAEGKVGEGAVFHFALPVLPALRSHLNERSMS